MTLTLVSPLMVDSTYLFNVAKFGAIGDGTADDTAAIQAAITKAQATGGTVYIPPGSYKITAPLAITSAVNIQGAGYTTDNINLFAASGYKSSTLIAYNTTVFNIATDHAVILEKFGIVYRTAPTDTSTPAILLDTGNQGSVHANKESVFRDIFIIGPGVGIKAVNALSFLFDHVHIEGANKYSMILQDVNYPGSGDSVVTNCVMSSSAVLSHMLVNSGGGLRIINNKCNSCSNGGAGIIIQPNASSQAISPLFICNNSIEFVGCDNGIGILFQRNVGTELAGNLVISANEIAGGNVNSKGITMQSNGATPWIQAGAITGNFIYSTTFGIAIEGASDINVVGNTVIGAGTGYGSSGVATNIQFTANLKGPGVA